ncbi:MAG TPA: outer membrane beta-barrel protein [Roseiarcus sp.]
MASLKALTLTSVAVLALTRLATAADLLPPAPELPPPIAPAEFSGWYLRGDVGISENFSKPSVSISPDPVAAGLASGFLAPGADNTFLNPTISQSALFDAGVGYQVNNWFRADVTGELRGGGEFQSLKVLNDLGNNRQFADFYRANTSSAIGLVNAYADLGTWYGITPFVGAGVGVAYNRLSGLTDTGLSTQGRHGVFPTGGYASDHGATNFAWALMAGLDFNVTQNLKLELGYRYLNYGGFTSGAINCLDGGGCNCTPSTISTKTLASNDVRIGLRWMIGDNFAPPPPEPLVRKY